MHSKLIPATVSMSDLSIQNAAEPWDIDETERSSSRSNSHEIPGTSTKISAKSKSPLSSQEILLPEDRIPTGSSILSFLFDDNLEINSSLSLDSLFFEESITKNVRETQSTDSLRIVKVNVNVSITETEDLEVNPVKRTTEVDPQPIESDIEIAEGEQNGSEESNISISEAESDSNEELFFYPSSPEQILYQPQQRISENYITTKPQRRKKEKSSTSPKSSTALLKLQLEHELGYHALYDTGRNYSFNNFRTRNNKLSETRIPIIPVYRMEPVGRRFTKEDAINRHHEFHEEAAAFRKLSNTTKVLIVDEDTRAEDALQHHMHAMEKRLNRNNTSALGILEVGSLITTPLGWEYSDRVLRIKHHIAWEVALCSPMVKKGVVETSIPVAATHFYTRRISFWHRICCRLKLCCTWVWRTPNSDIEIESGLLTSESIEAFQQELNVMEFLGAKYKRTSERRGDVVGISKSMKRFMETSEVQNKNKRKRS